MEQIVPRKLLMRKKGVAVQVKSRATGAKKNTKTAVRLKNALARRPRAAIKRALALGKKAPQKKTVRPKSARRAETAPLKEVVSPSSILSQDHGPLAVPKYFFSTDIPDVYNETYMRALQRDPLWIFAYWEISQNSIDMLKTSMGDRFGGARWVLRVSDVTDIDYNGANAWRSMDVDVTCNANSWYIKVWEPCRVYLIQGGLITLDRVFFEAVRSNALQMPSAGVSAATDREWSAAESDELLGVSAVALNRSIGASERWEEAELGAGLEIGPGRGLGSGAVL
jgi:hypothetical protein